MSTSVSEECIGSIFRAEKCYLLHVAFFFDPEDGVDMFL
jgi:hypothetical protein